MTKYEEALETLFRDWNWLMDVEDARAFKTLEELVKKEKEEEEKENGN